MMILAIDPGPKQSAYLFWDEKRDIGEHGIVLNEDLIEHLWTYSAMADAVAIEMIASYGMAVGAEVFETCVWIGRFMQAACSERPLLRIPRAEIKMHLCKSTRAKDANVRQSLIDRFGAPGTKKASGVLYGIKSHEWAALAVAVTAYDRLESRNA